MLCFNAITATRSAQLQTLVINFIGSINFIIVVVEGLGLQQFINIIIHVKLLFAISLFTNHLLTIHLLNRLIGHYVQIVTVSLASIASFNNSIAAGFRAGHREFAARPSSVYYPRHSCICNYVGDSRLKQCRLMTTLSLSYLNGFNNEHQTEALPGALPVGQFNPQKNPYGLYTEQFSTTAFTMSRAQNRRTWFYRIRPSVVQGNYQAMSCGLVRTAPITEINASPEMLRWGAFELPQRPTDFIDGLITLAANGDAKTQTGIGIHIYSANQSMVDRVFCNADGELLIVPQLGGLLLQTECGKLVIQPGDIGVIPRGLKFKVDLIDTQVRGYICENYGAPLDLPERGPVGANGFANDRDFQYPTAAYDDDDNNKFELVSKFCGGFFRCEIKHSPFDVVAWVGNSAPYKYDLSRFNAVNTVSFDHPDPSIFTVLSSASSLPGMANVDFVIFPPRWMVAENTFRPPWYHRNIMSEFMGLVEGVYDAKETGFVPGGASLHNCMSPHGPEAAVFEKATNTELKPERYRDTLAFMFESRFVIAPTRYALDTPVRQRDYSACWRDIQKHFDPGEPG